MWRPELNVTIAVLAAGRSTRTGARHKLLAQFDGIPLIRRSTQRASEIEGIPVLVVTGYREATMRDALAGLDITITHNFDYAAGISSSIRSAIRAVSGECVGLLVHLADMPLVERSHFSSMIRAFEDHGGEIIVRATSSGRPGNPVLLPRALFSQIEELEGDIGARNVIAHSGLTVVDVEIGCAAECDVDTIEALLAAGGQPAVD